MMLGFICAASQGSVLTEMAQKNPDIVMLYTCMRGQTGPEAAHTGFGLHGAALARFVLRRV